MKRKTKNDLKDVISDRKRRRVLLEKKKKYTYIHTKEGKGEIHYGKGQSGVEGEMILKSCCHE